MQRTVAIGIQNFEDYIMGDYFYIDKSKFIKEWWESGDNTTVIMRPRRFGKTLTMDMVKTFFSFEYKEKGEAIFGGLEIWQDEKIRAIQGTYPVVFISFADIKPTRFIDMKNDIRELFAKVYRRYRYLLKSDKISDEQKIKFTSITAEKEEINLAKVINNLSEMLVDYHSKKVIIILDEYDTPMLEAYRKGFWSEAVEFLRSFFNSTFKTNPYMERALMTGITRISKESIFSDFNHVKIVTTLSNKYADSFGFTEDEVFVALDEYNLGSEKENVKAWYNGFVIGNKKDIYNPWSIISFLENDGKYAPYWANTSGNGLVSQLLIGANVNIKESMQILLEGKSIRVPLDEEIVYNTLKDDSEKGIWSLLFASGYLTGTEVQPIDYFNHQYDLHLTNFEIRLMFCNMISNWFRSAGNNYNDFIKALLKGDIKPMNYYMNNVALATFSYFDTGKNPSGYSEPEKFYHGFVLGLIIDLREEYSITSNRESGFGRYDVIMEPKDIKKYDAIILEFKVHDPDDEKDLKETVESALKQINEKNYSASLIEKGIPAEKIKKYGFAFEGKKVLIGNEY